MDLYINASRSVLWILGYLIGDIYIYDDTLGI